MTTLPVLLLLVVCATAHFSEFEEALDIDLRSTKPTCNANSEFEEALDIDLRSTKPKCNAKHKISKEQIKVLLDTHNKYRKEAGAVHMPNLKWDDSLANVAQELIDQCKFQHDYLTDCKNRRLGQNLHMKSQRRNKATKPRHFLGVVRSWHKENKNYNLKRNRCKKGKMCGHYTQLVWAKTKYVGCASGWCKNMKGNPFGSRYAKKGGYLTTVCNYWPPGNYRGVRPFKKA